MYIPQAQLERLISKITPGKVIVIFGPRRVGKTTLIKKYLQKEENALFVSGEDIFIQGHLSKDILTEILRRPQENAELIRTVAQENPQYLLQLSNLMCKDKPWALEIVEKYPDLLKYPSQRATR